MQARGPPAPDRVPDFPEKIDRNPENFRAKTGIAPIQPPQPSLAKNRKTGHFYDRKLVPGQEQIDGGVGQGQICDRTAWPDQSGKIFGFRSIERSGTGMREYPAGQVTTIQFYPSMSPCRCTSPCRKQPVSWSLTMPTACMKA